MNKRDRKRLYVAMRAMVEARARIVDESVEDSRFDFEAVTEAHGRVQGSFYLAEDHRRKSWMPCRLKDWEVDEHGYSVSQPWHGFDHWKQNYFPYVDLSVEEFVKGAQEHLERLGLRVQESVAK